MPGRWACLPSFLALALAASPARAETVDQLLARYVAARGGLARIRAVNSLRFTGQLTLGDIATPLVLELKRPRKMRTEFQVQGRRAVRAFDGEKGWVTLPVPGLDAPQLMPEDESREAREQADVDLSPLVDSAAKGYTIELAGREVRGEREYWKLIVKARDGTPRAVFLDPKTCLAVRSEEQRVLEGQIQDFVTIIGDYRTVGGLLFPFLLEVGPKASEERQRVVFEKVEINPPLDDARFAFAGARPPPVR
jgi:hypothetical protein